MVGFAYLGLLCLGVMSQDEVTEVTELEASNVTVNSNITGDPRVSLNREVVLYVSPALCLQSGHTLWY